MSMCVLITPQGFTFFGYIQGGSINHIWALFLIFGGIYAIFCNGYNNLYSHQQYIIVPFVITLMNTGYISCKTYKAEIG